ncbi:MAG: GvpL/GvpF family gas vesicle protein [Desulfitobacteriaceae bacterium]
MNKVYLLGFVRDCREAPVIEGFAPKLTHLGRHGVVWSPSPVKLFWSKEEFLSIMLKWLEHACDLGITMLPVHLGISAQEEDLLDILRVYQGDLERDLEKITGCREYDIGLDLSQTSYPIPIPSPAVHDGKGYLELMRRRESEREAHRQEILKGVGTLIRRLAPWTRDYSSQISPNMRGADLAFLVPDGLEQDFRRDLQSLIGEADRVVNWTGPWPPFHFSSFEFKTDGLVTSGPLVWGKGRVSNE